MMDISNFIRLANRYGGEKEAFLFVIDFEMKKPILILLSEINREDILFKIKEKTNCLFREKAATDSALKVFPISYVQYQKAFMRVQEFINNGDSYLLNLTFPTPVNTDYSLKDFFINSDAPYKLYLRNQFTLFSPETFVKTQNNVIYSYPMKGTIDASVPNAREIILHDKKEKWEHNTIVDLIRNDLSMVAKDIVVKRFRYISSIKTSKGELLQVSSEIAGKLSGNWQKEIGDVLVNLLPAGSISGAPKQKTLEIIEEVEGLERGYFTGVFGVFDGENIDSAVNIRYIERTTDGLQFRSGGGITANSKPTAEYDEMIDKVYVPIS